MSGLQFALLLFLQLFSVSSNFIFESFILSSVLSSKESIYESPISSSDGGVIYIYLRSNPEDLIVLWILFFDGIKGLKNFCECPKVAEFPCGSDSSAIERNVSMKSEFYEISWFLFLSFLAILVYSSLWYKPSNWLAFGVAANGVFCTALLLN